jgi:thiamine-monophosphate kinase
MRNEEQVIKEIARRAGGAAGRAGSSASAGLLRLGIGDDAAILDPKQGKRWVVSCDAYLEGIHFLSRVTPPDAIGWKALVRAASDLAAMGATPRLFFLTLAIPGKKTGRWLDQFALGMGRAARRLGLVLAGGDTTANDRVAISIAVLGEVQRGKAVRRSGARAGDIIYVSGRLGRAELGLRILRAGLGGGRRYAALIRPHFYPEIRVEMGKWLAARGVASAMMDISDGLSTDLARLVRASGVGARIWSDCLPCVEAPKALAGRAGFDSLEMALHGGDDYELVFTVPRRKAKMLRGAPVGMRLTAIGEITKQKGVVLVSEEGREEILRPGGWEPFRRHSK